MKKKILGLLLVTLCITLVGCGKKGNQEGILGGKSSKVEYKDYNDNGKVDYLDKMFAHAQVNGFNIEYKVTENGTTSTHRLAMKNNLILALYDDENNGEMLEFKVLEDGKKGTHYKKENGTWRNYGSIGLPNSKDDMETTMRKDMYIYVERVANIMEKTYITENNKVEEVTYLGRKCTKYVYTYTFTTMNKTTEKTIYVDNETEMPLYFKDEEKTVETTKFELKADISVPEV